MRGKALISDLLGSHNGITPAYAGKSLDLKWKAKKQQDHPRLCGEKAVLPSKAPQMAGSPPPMRGKAGTPARGLPAEGSPPPMRGKVVDFDHVIAEDRITPAYAGKSLKRAKLRGVD